MTGAWSLLGRAMALALVWGALAAYPGGAQDPGGGSLTIYGAVCPVDYAGDSFAEECAATPAAGASYQVRNTETGAMRPIDGGFAIANDEGIVTFEGLAGLAPGVIQILAMAPDNVGVLGGYIVPDVSCSAERTPDVEAELLDTEFTGMIIELVAQADDDLRCDAYFTPFSPPGGGDPTPSAETPGPAAAATPVPGRPGAVYAGDCPLGGADPGNVVSTLTALSAPDGESAGQPAAVVAETSFSVIPLSLEQLFAEPQVIGVGSLGEDAPGLVACGEIGGARNAAGHLVIGLREVGDSGFTGIAFLAPSAASPDRTNISVFIAAGLAGEHQETAGRGAVPAFAIWLTSAP